MKIKFDKDKLLVRIDIENDIDLLDAEKIKRLLASDEWKTLAIAFLHVRESILEGIKNVLNTEANFRNAALKAAVLKGFDQAVGMAEEIVVKADLERVVRLQNLEREEKENANEEDGPTEFEPDAD